MEEKMFELMTKMYSEMQEMKGDMKEMKQDISGLKQDVSSLKKDMVRMEDKMDAKLSALFDGYKQNTEQIQELKKELSSQEEFIIKRVK